MQKVKNFNGETDKGKGRRICLMWKSLSYAPNRVLVGGHPFWGLLNSPICVLKWNTVDAFSAWDLVPLNFFLVAVVGLGVGMHITRGLWGDLTSLSREFNLHPQQ